MMTEPDQFIPTRRSLLSRLKNWEDRESWQDFFDTYWRLIYSVAIKAGLSDAEAQDVVQETVLVVARKIGEFKSDPALGSFKGWLMLITRRRIADQFQNRRKSAVSHISASSDAVSIASRAPVVSLRDDTTRTSTANRVPDPATFSLEACWEEQWQKNLVELAMEKARNLVSPKQFQMFELYTLREWPVEKVAKALGVSAGQVYLAKHRVSALVKKEARKLEKSGSCGPHRSRAPL